MQELEKHIKGDWIKSLDSDSNNIKWIPLFTVEFDENYKRTFGLTYNGNWMNQIIQSGKETIAVVKNKKEFIKIIAVLEIERSVIEKKLLEGLKINTDTKYNIHIFPFTNLIKYALQDGPIYWVKHAISWLKPDEFDQELYTISNRIISEKKLDQGARHDLFKLVKAFEKSR